MDSYRQAANETVDEAVVQGKSMLADGIERYSDVAADWISKTISKKARDAARYLRTHDRNAMWNDARHVARHKPWLVASIGIVGGYVATQAARSVFRGQPPPELR